MASNLPGRPRYLGFLPDFIFLTDSRPARYIGRAWLLALVPSILLSLAVTLLFPGAGREPYELTPIRIILSIFAVPLIETLMMAVPLLLVNRLAGPGPAVIASSLLWGLLHGTVAVTWGLVAWWPFLILSIAFLTWRPRGFLAATSVATAIHALQNGFAMALMLVLERVA